MNAEAFRRIALGLKDVVEGAHMGHPDFRLHNKIFATLHADMASGMVKLTPDQQRKFLNDDPAAFMPESGAWGRSGSTRVNLGAVNEDTLGEAMTLAWRNAAETAVAARAKRRQPGPRRPIKRRSRTRSDDS
jgi:hypothetical protein